MDGHNEIDTVSFFDVGARCHATRFIFIGSEKNSGGMSRRYSI